MKKLLLMISLISTILMASPYDDCVKDIKLLLPVAKKWTRFTTEFDKYYSTKIIISKKVNPFVINYKILDLQKKVIFEDFITIPIKVEKRRNVRLVIGVGMGSFLVGILSGIIIIIKIEK